MSNLKMRDKMRFVVNMLGFKKTYDMTPEDIVRNVAYNMAGLYPKLSTKSRRMNFT